MSHRLLSNLFDEPHDSVHDMESLLWVLIYLCMTIDGPGGKPRAAVKEERKRITRINEYFFADDIPLKKAEMFGEPSELGHEILDEHLLKHFHSSFEGVKGLVHQWLSTLRLCYKIPQCAPAVHELFLKQINQTIVQFQEPSDLVYRKQSEDEKRRRMEYEKKIQDFSRDRNSAPFATGLPSLEDTPTKNKVIGRRLQTPVDPASSAHTPKDSLLSVPSGSGSKRQKRS